MNPTPSPSPVEVFVHTGPAEWWQIVAALGPLAVLLGALVAGVIGWRTLRQKAIADNRAEWWKRTQWALDAVYSGDKKRGTVGLKVLKVLAGSELAGKEEQAVLEAAWERPLVNAFQRRKRWAMDAVDSGDKKSRIVGLKVLQDLAESELAGEEEQADLELAWARSRLGGAESPSTAEEGEADAAVPDSLSNLPAGERIVDVPPTRGDNGEEGTPGPAEGGRR